MTQVTRFHPLLMALRWLLAIFIIGALLGGYFVFTPMPNSDPRKIGILMLRMAGGMLIFTLMLIRFIVGEYARRNLPTRPRAIRDWIASHRLSIADFMPLCC